MSSYCVCDPEPKKKDIDNDVKLVIDEVETLDTLAKDIGVRPLGEFGLGSLDEDPIRDRTGVIEELEELLRRLKLVAKGKTRFRFVTVE